MGAAFDIRGAGPVSAHRAPPERVRFTVPGVVVPWARAGRHAGVSFTPERQQSFGAAVRQFAFAAMAGAPLLECAVHLRVVATYPWPRLVTKQRREASDGAWKATRPDIDNACVKLVADALNQVVWRDDAQVAALSAFKLFGEPAGLEITVTPLVGVAPAELGA